jgi:hypothetical protein
MKKYFYGFIGILIGFLLSLTISAHAEVISMIGKVIQGEFPIKVNGSSLDNKAFVVDGTSYLPVRAIAESVGMDVYFNADLGIELKNKEVAKPVNTPTNTVINTSPTPTPQRVWTLTEINERIATIKMQIEGSETLLGVILKRNPESKEISIGKSRIADLQSQLTELEQKKAELNK